MKNVYLFLALLIIFSGCSTANKSSYFGYNNNPALPEDNSIIESSNNQIVVTDSRASNDNLAGNNVFRKVDDNPQNVYNYYIIPPRYFNRWNSPTAFFYFEYGYPYYGFDTWYDYNYWDNYYYHPYYDYYDYYCYNPYRYNSHYYHHHHYYPYYGGYYSDEHGGNYDGTPRKNDYRDFGVSRGEYGYPTRNVINSSSSRSQTTESGRVFRNTDNPQRVSEPTSNGRSSSDDNVFRSNPSSRSSRSNSDENRSSGNYNEQPSRNSNSNNNVANPNSGSSSRGSSNSGSMAPSRGSSSESSGRSSGSERSNSSSSGRSSGGNSGSSSGSGRSR